MSLNLPKRWSTCDTGTCNTTSLTIWEITRRATMILWLVALPLIGGTYAHANESINNDTAVSGNVVTDLGKAVTGTMGYVVQWVKDNFNDMVDDFKAKEFYKKAEEESKKQRKETYDGMCRQFPASKKYCKSDSVK